MALKLHVTRSGAGPPVVLLHGLFGAGDDIGPKDQNQGQDFNKLVLARARKLSALFSDN